MTNAQNGVFTAAMVGAPASRVDALAGPARGEKDPRVAAREFAGLFYSMMVAEMRKTVPEDPFMGGAGQETFQTMWTSEIGRLMAARPGDALTAGILAGIENSSGTAGTAALEGGQG
jgi:Rod binding domain-containing protein